MKSRRILLTRLLVGVGLAGMVLVIPGAAGATISSARPVILRAVTFAPDSPHQVPVTPESAPDAAIIGKVLGASPEAGGQWQATQQAMGPYSEKLTAAAGDRLVGSFVPRGVDVYAAHVRISGTEASRSVEAVAAQAANAVGVVVTVEYMDAPALSVMTAASAKFGPKLRAAQDGVGDVFVDESASEVVIEVTRGVGDPERAQLQADDYFGSVGIPYRIDITDEDWRVEPF